MNLNRKNSVAFRVCGLAIITCILSSPFGLAGSQDDRSVSGKVVTYEPQKKILIKTKSEGTKEFSVSSKTIFQDANGNRKDYIDLRGGVNVQIEMKKGDTKAISIRPTPDVAGPDYNPTPKPR